ncbi:MAG: hypothetical protein ACI83I_001026 [Bacteroidia bacterium]|jgi:hypothetical protein
MNIFLIKPTLTLALCVVAFGFLGCSDEPTTTSPTDNNTTDELAIYKRIYGASSVTSDGSFVTIQTNGMPDHKSVYYAASDPLFEDFSGTTFGGVTFRKNPNSIVSQTLTFRIPLNPAEATNHSATSLGPIGVAMNGVALYNQYAGPNEQELTNEITSFDKYYGHPQGQGQYHYHVEPIYLTEVRFSRSSLMGFLLDGFPVYGPEEENGSLVTSSQLDDYHGHSHATLDYPNGIYHYHFTADAPYMNGNGYYGTAGTVTQ